jgi:hypothetical protein
MKGFNRRAGHSLATLAVWGVHVASAAITLDLTSIGLLAAPTESLADANPFRLN